MRSWITGYFGQQNVGDEAILASVLQHVPSAVRPRILTPRNVALVERVHGTSVCLEPPFDGIRGRYGLCHGAGYWLRRGYRIALDIPQTKACVIAGGGWLNDHVVGRVVNKQKRLAALKRWNCRVGLLSVGVDRMNSTEDREAAQRIVDEVLYCSVRDRSSAEALAELGVALGRYRQTADLAFALRLPPFRPAHVTPDRLSQAVVGLNLRPLFNAAKERGDRKERRATEYQGACRTLVEKLKSAVSEVLLLPFNPADAKLLGDIAADIGSRVMHLDDDPVRMAVSLRDCDAVIGMRYHAAVLAVIQGIPCVPIPYASKSVSLGEELGVECDDLVVGDGVLVNDQPLLPDAVMNRLEWVWGYREKLLPHWATMCQEKACMARQDMRKCWEMLTA